MTAKVRSENKVATKRVAEAFADFLNELRYRKAIMARIAEKGISPQSFLSDRRDAMLGTSRETKFVSTNREKECLKKEPKPNTCLETLRLVESGLSFEDIARERGLTVGTIVKHICTMIKDGKLQLCRFVSHEKEQILRKELTDKSHNIYANLDKLPSDITMNDIKMVIADIRRTSGK